MTQLLLAVEHVTCWSLLAAWLAALSVHSRRTGVLLYLLFIAAPLAVLGGVAVHLVRHSVDDALPLLAAAPLQFMGTVLIVSAAASAAVFRLARRPGPDGVPRAADWPARLLGASCGVAVVVHLTTCWNLDLSVRQRIETLRVEAGAIAVSLAPLATPDSQNAALFYQEAADSGLLASYPPEYETWFEILSKTPDALPVEDPRFVAYVERRAPLVRHLRQATQFEVCNFRRDWARPHLGMLLPETQMLSGCGHELILSARLHAARGRTDEALLDLAALHRLADHAGQEPIIVSLLVSAGLERMAFDNLEFILRTRPLDAEQIARLAAESPPAERLDWRPYSASLRYQRALRMEESFGLATFCQVASGSVDLDLLSVNNLRTSNAALPIYRAFVFDSDLAGYRERLTRLQNAAVAAHEARTRVSDSIQQDLDAGQVGPLGRQLLLHQNSIGAAVDAADARQRLARVALLLLAHRARSGAFPDSVDSASLDAVVPCDPFTGRPFKTIRQGDALVLYSVGPDLKDDQGRRIGPPSSAKLDGDLSLTLQLAPAKTLESAGSP